MPARPSRLKTGHRYEFVCLQLDIAGHSKLPDAERILHQAKERFRKQVSGIVVGTYGGLPFKWEGDGGAFLFPVTDGREFDEAVRAALRVLETLPSINEELQPTTGLGQPLSLRISLDSGTAAYDKDPGLITGDFLNAFLKNERAVGLVGEVTVTERVYRQASESLRGRFTAYKDSAELGCRIYRSNVTGREGASGPSPTDRMAEPSSETPPQRPTAEGGTPSSDQAHRQTDRNTLVMTLEQLAPSDFASVVTRIPGAASHVSRHGTVREQAAELIRWVESSTGPGLDALREALNF
jgi:hypothetical protein